MLLLKDPLAFAILHFFKLCFLGIGNRAVGLRPFLGPTNMAFAGSQTRGFRAVEFATAYPLPDAIALQVLAGLGTTRESWGRETQKRDQG
jgi:hypothetical protein